MDTLLQDVRYGVRQLLRQRGSSLIAIVTLALGIGMTTAIFSVIDATMLRPLPYPHPEQLVEVSPEETMPDGRVSRATASMEDMRTWQKSADVFSLVAGYGSSFRGRIVEGSEPKRLQVGYFTEDYLPMHGVTPVIGRNFTREDMELSAPLAALISYGYWQSQYAGSQSVIGQTIRFDTETATIVGVMPRSLEADTPISTAMRIPVDEYARRGTGRVGVYGRLQSGITVEQARERLSARMEVHTLPDGSKTSNPNAHVDSRLDYALKYARTTVNVLTGAVALILLIACVNVAGLLLARGAARQSELAVRASMGAGRARLIRQLITESIVLAIPGGALGVLLAWLSLDTIVANVPLSISSDSPVAINVRVLAATLAILLPTAVLFGLVPAIRLSRVKLGSVLALTGRQRGSSLSRRGGQVLIAAEIALALVLVTGSGLMIRSFMKISSVDLGFDPSGLVAMQVLPLDRTPAVHNDFYRRIEQQIRTMPNVGASGIVDNFSLGGGTSFSSLTVDGKSQGASVFRATPGYFNVIGAVLRSGRFPTDADYAAGARGVVISELAEQKIFGGHAVGREFTRAGKDKAPWTVIGVIKDLKHGGPLATRAEPAVFYPLIINEFDLNTSMMVVVRPKTRGAGFSDQLRRTATELGPRVLVERIRTSEELFGDRVVTPRRRTVLLGLLGALGLVLALVGVFGMTGYSVTRRTGEIGVRMAFGARPDQVVRTIMRDAAIPIAIGVCAGLGGALLAAKTIESFLFATAPRDAATLAIVAVVLTVTGIIAALIPALRAAKVDPSSSLRAD